VGLVRRWKTTIYC